MELHTGKMSILTCSTDVDRHPRTSLILRPTLQVVFGRPRAFALSPLIVCDITSLDQIFLLASVVPVDFKSYTPGRYWMT